VNTDVEAVNRAHAVVILDTGEEVSVTNWLDDCGDECVSDDATVAVAGPDKMGRWYAIDLSAFEPVRLS
jgi:hypothetical protein